MLQDTQRQVLESLILLQISEVSEPIHLYLRYLQKKKLGLEYLMLQQIDLTETGQCIPIIQV